MTKNNHQLCIFIDGSHIVLITLVSRKYLYINDHLWFPLCTFTFGLPVFFFVRWFPLCIHHFCLLERSLSNVSSLINTHIYGGFLFNLWFKLCTHPFCVLQRSFDYFSFMVYALYQSVLCPEKIFISTFITCLHLVPIRLAS